LTRVFLIFCDNLTSRPYELRSRIAVTVSKNSSHCLVQFASPFRYVFLRSL